MSRIMLRLFEVSNLPKDLSYFHTKQGGHTHPSFGMTLS